MNILMFTNTIAPIAGGLERSIQNFTKEYRKAGHRVIIIAPEFKDQPAEEEDVIRIPAIQNFNGTDFSLNLPLPAMMMNKLKDIHPDIIHSHHPFLMGDMALRVAAEYKVPLIFTYHILFEQYMSHWYSGAKRFERFIVTLSMGYSNLADIVFAPSQSIKNLLTRRGVKTPIKVLPTGIYIEDFSNGDGKRLREKLNIAPKTFLIGHAGRLSPEKNLTFLIKSVIHFMKKNKSAEFLLVGTGESEEEIKTLFKKAKLQDRLHATGVLKGQDLIDAYHAMDVFVFSSKSETQGLVLLEAMATGTPVIAEDAPGVRDIIVDYKNGRLIQSENTVLFSSVLQWFIELSEENKNSLRKSARETAQEFTMDKMAKKALEIYKTAAKRTDPIEPSFWEKGMNRIQAEWDLLKNVVQATGAAIGEKKDPPGDLTKPISKEMPV